MQNLGDVEAGRALLMRAVAAAHQHGDARALEEAHAMLRRPVAAAAAAPSSPTPTGHPAA